MASRIILSASRAGKSRKVLNSFLPAWMNVRLSSSEALVVPDDKYLKYSSPVPVALDHSPFLTGSATRITTLENGLRVATSASPAAETATVGIWVDAGSRYESDASNGTAHFLEHLLFKGTARRSRRQLEEKIENMGGHLNAYTSREQTAYLSRVLKSDVPVAVDVLSDILQFSRFDKNLIEEERGTILKEMEEVGKKTEEILMDHLHATAFQHTPLGRTILGSAENVKTISKSDIEEYITTHYTAPRMVLVGSGAVDHDSLVSLAEKSFSSLPTDPTTAAQLVAQNPAYFTGSEVRIRDDDLPLAHIVISFEGATWSDPDSIPLLVMQAMLGSWSKASGTGTNAGSELAQLVASNNLAESVSAFTTSYNDTGLFGIHAVAPGGDDLSDLAWAIMHEVTRLVYRVSEDDVTRAKNQIKSSLILHSDNIDGKAEEIGRHLLIYGRHVPLAEMLARIDAVDSDTVKRVARRFIYDQDIALASVGPTQFLPDYNWFRRRTFWLRH